MQASSNLAAGPDFTATLLRRLAARQATIGVVGLGYVGLPLSLQFASSGLRVIGLDADSGSIDLVRKAGFQAMVADADALSAIHLPAAPSAISMLDVLEHLQDPVEALGQLRRIGKPGMGAY